MKSRCIARFFLFLSVTFLLLEQTATRCAGEGSPAPIDVGSRKQLFIDERFIAASSDVAMILPLPTPPGCGDDAVRRTLEDLGQQGDGAFESPRALVALLLRPSDDYVLGVREDVGVGSYRDRTRLETDLCPVFRLDIEVYGSREGRGVEVIPQGRQLFTPWHERLQ